MTRQILALAGGVGGAKLALGLAGVLPAEALTVAVNTADDFEHLGLTICPDLDTVMYTLAGVANPETGWGRRDESWTVMEALGQLGGETWFRLGDKDLATHIERTRRLRRRREPVVGHARSVDTPRRQARDGADVRRSGAHHGDDRPRRARLPGLVRAAALRAGGEVRALRRRRQGQAASCPARPRRPARHRRLPVQSLRQRSADPRRARACGRRLPGRGRRRSPSRRSSAARRSRARPRRCWRSSATTSPPWASRVTTRTGSTASCSMPQDAGLARDIEALGLRVRVADTMMRNDSDKRRLARRRARIRGRTRGLWATLLTCSRRRSDEVDGPRQGPPVRRARRGGPARARAADAGACAGDPARGGAGQRAGGERRRRHRRPQCRRRRRRTPCAGSRARPNCCWSWPTCRTSPPPISPP